MISGLDSTSVTFVWEPPVKESQNGVIIGYRIDIFDSLNDNRS